jgi:hypothetical protein
MGEEGTYTFRSILARTLVRIAPRVLSYSGALIPVAETSINHILRIRIFRLG